MSNTLRTPEHDAFFLRQTNGKWNTMGDNTSMLHGNRWTRTDSCLTK